jgi:two-component system nitrate/nitrite response regulator NarL
MWWNEGWWNVSQVDPAAMKVVTRNSRSRWAGNQESKTKAVSRFPTMPIRVYVLRVDPLRAAGLRAIFEENAGIDIIVEDAADQVGSGWLDPSVRVVVVGTQLGAGTFKLVASIQSARPDLNILVMSPAAGDETVLTVLNLGAKGFLHEGITAAEFEEAVRSVASGSIWAPRKLQAELIHRLLASRAPQVSIENVNFTGREQQVLNLLVDGRSNREIAHSLKIEERTVKSYVTRLLRKMSVKNRTALSMLAMSAKDH